MDISYDLYASALYKLSKTKYLYFNEINEIQIFFPHLDDDCLKIISSKLLFKNKKSITIAIPSIAIYGIYHVVKVGKVNSSVFKYLLSYVDMFNIMRNNYETAFYIKTAVSFEIDNWNNHLIYYNWNEVITYNILSKPNKYNSRTLMFSIYVVYDDDKNILMNKQESQNDPYYLDNHIKLITYNKLIFKELSYSKIIIEEYVCNNCSCYITNQLCTCDFDFHNQPACKVLWLPNKLINFIFENINNLQCDDNSTVSYSMVSFPSSSNIQQNQPINLPINYTQNNDMIDFFVDTNISNSNAISLDDLI